MTSLHRKQYFEIKVSRLESALGRQFYQSALGRQLVLNLNATELNNDCLVLFQSKD